VVVVSDGVATLGDVDRAAIVSATRALADSGVQRVDAIAVGGIRDDAALRQMTTAGLTRDGVVADGAADTQTLVRRLTSGGALARGGGRRRRDVAMAAYDRRSAGRRRISRVRRGPGRCGGPDVD
jgi:hypothetical protein